MVSTYSAAMAVGHWLPCYWWVEGVGPAVAKAAEALMGVGVVDYWVAVEEVASCP